MNLPGDRSPGLQSGLKNVENSFTFPLIDVTVSIAETLSKTNVILRYAPSKHQRARLSIPWLEGGNITPNIKVVLQHGFTMHAL